jgi:hypothetical protein
VTRGVELGEPVAEGIVYVYGARVKRSNDKAPPDFRYRPIDKTSTMAIEKSDPQ